MFLYLFRHAEAVSVASSDAARVLTEKGVKQAKEVGRFCLKNRLLPELILTSPYCRSEQTARLFAEEINQPNSVLIAPFLACGMDPETALAELADYKELDSVMIVGHEPAGSLPNFSEPAIPGKSKSAKPRSPFLNWT